MDTDRDTPLDTDLAPFSRLGLLVERIADAETLSAAQSAALQSEADAARAAREAGDLEAARRHVEKLTQLVTTLLEGKALARKDAEAVLQVANHLLNPTTDPGDGGSGSPAAHRRGRQAREVSNAINARQTRKDSKDSNVDR
jgi:hypothetical protein